MAGRRRFGNVRKLPSGRWQASFWDPEGLRRNAPETFSTKRAAEQWLAQVETDRLRGTWRDPDAVAESLTSFGNRWITERPGLRPRTVDLYRWLFRRYVVPELGEEPVDRIDAARVRTWRAELLAEGVSPTMTAKAYRLLRAVLMTAVEDGLIPVNPCRIRGAGSEPTPERPVLQVAQVLDLAAAVPRRYRALVMVTVFGSLRWGEVTGLRRGDLDVERGQVRVREALAERSTGEIVRGRPKSRAGVRTVTLPAPVREVVAVHLERFVPEGAEQLVFTGPTGAVLRRSNFNRLVDWPEVVSGVGAPGLHFHDLRHTGNMFAAGTGATLRDLMVRMGHDSMRAALIYQHATRAGDEEIAQGLGLLLSGAPEVPAGDGGPEASADGAAAPGEDTSSEPDGPAGSGAERDR